MLKKSLMLVVLSLALGACGDDQVQPEPPNDGVRPIDNSGAGAANQGLGGYQDPAAGGFGSNDGGGQFAVGQPTENLIHFEYDSAQVDAAGRNTLAEHAAYLGANPGVRVVLAGYADERGTREYNIALGYRRAEAVRRALVISGVRAQQMDSVSFGEEKPLDFGSNDKAWSQNRRVEITYRQ